MVPPLSLSNFTVSLHGRVVVNLPELTLKAGELLHLLGPNGAGKTTLLRALGGELAFGGSALICGQPPGSLRARQASIYVPTDADLLPDLTVRESLSFLAAIWTSDTAPLLNLAHGFGLAPYLDAWPDDLSRGTRQKVALSAALGLALPLTLLDEPFATLDTGSRQVLLDAISERSAAGSAVIVTTHGDEVAGLHPRQVRLAELVW
jgi:ABC-type multidrug transport system ATPase subunit